MSHTAPRLRFGYGQLVLLALFAAACTRAAPPILPGALPVSAAPQRTALTMPQPATVTTAEPAPLDPPPAATVTVVVTEVMSDPLLLEDAAGEYLELINLSDISLRLADIHVRLPSGKVATPDRPHQPLWSPGEVVLLSALGLQQGSVRLKGLKLPNPAGRLEIWHHNQLLDVAHWHNKRPWPKRRPGVALERRSLTAGGQASAWRRSATRQRGQEYGSPGLSQLPCRELLQTPWGQGSGAAQLARDCPRPMVVRTIRFVEPARSALGHTTTVPRPPDALEVQGGPAKKAHGRTRKH